MEARPAPRGDSWGVGVWATDLPSVAQPAAAARDVLRGGCETGGTLPAAHENLPMKRMLCHAAEVRWRATFPIARARERGAVGGSCSMWPSTGIATASSSTRSLWGSSGESGASRRNRGVEKCRRCRRSSEPEAPMRVQVRALCQMFSRPCLFPLASASASGLKSASMRPPTRLSVAPWCWTLSAPLLYIDPPPHGERCLATREELSAEAVAEWQKAMAFAGPDPGLPLIMDGQNARRALRLAQLQDRSLAQILRQKRDEADPARGAWASRPCSMRASDNVAPPARAQPILARVFQATLWFLAARSPERHLRAAR